MQGDRTYIPYSSNYHQDLWYFPPSYLSSFFLCLLVFSKPNNQHNQTTLGPHWKTSRCCLCCGYLYCCRGCRYAPLIPRCLIRLSLPFSSTPNTSYSGAFSSLKDLCHAIKAGEGTAKNRMREIKKELMQITGKYFCLFCFYFFIFVFIFLILFNFYIANYSKAPKLPWLREINIKDMHKHLGKMLSQLETITRLTEARNAPQPQSSQNVRNISPPLPFSLPPITL